MDILGPLTLTDSGNKYILIISDYFSKWCVAVALPNVEAPTVARAFIDHYLSVLGLSESAHADQGVQFEAKLFQEVCKILGIKKTRSSPYFAQSAGLVERLNSTVEAMLTKLVSEHQRDWDQYLQLAMWAYRSAPHASTGYSPSMMMYGREMTMPVDLVFGRPKPDVGGQRGNHLCFSAA